MASSASKCLSARPKTSASALQESCVLCRLSCSICPVKVCSSFAFRYIYRLVLYPGCWVIQNHPRTRIKHRPQRPNSDESNKQKITEDAEQHTTHYPKPESSTENILSFSSCCYAIQCRHSDKKPRYSFQSCFLFEEGCFLHYLQHCDM